VTLEMTYADDLVGTEWKSPASGLWVASEAGTYLGMVERIESRYVVSDATGRDLGSYLELADAQKKLDGFDGEPITSTRDVLMMKAIIVMTGVTALSLALSVVLRWQI
jgi:hypothetical protein